MLSEEPQAKEPLREAVDVLSISLAPESDGDHEYLHLGLMHPIDDSIALTDGPQVAIALEFSQEGFSLDVGIVGEPVNSIANLLQHATVLNGR